MAPPMKKRKLAVTAVEKIDFDPSARAEYLTGFHKRKVARQKFAQDEAAKKDKEEKLRLRKEVRHICTHSHICRYKPHPVGSDATPANEWTSVAATTAQNRPGETR
jgi:hypothetical protein